MSNKDKAVIKLENLTRYYGKTRGIENVNLEVKKGEIFGFLGPNGAGKTTTINLLLDLISPTSGRALVFNNDPRKRGKQIRKRVGFLPGEMGFYDNMSGLEYLRFFAGLQGKNCDEKIRDLSHYFFNIRLQDKIKSYSRGMKQLTGLIQAFMASPDLYILDEPTSNLDPLMVQRFYDLIKKEASGGKTVFLSSHQLGEVESVCDRVCIIKDGGIVLVDEIENIRKQMNRTFRVSFKENVDINSLKVEGTGEVKKIEDIFEIEVTGKLNPILARLSELEIDKFNYTKMTLEEIFHKYFED